jgi:hypothetical protein
MAATTGANVALERQVDIGLLEDNSSASTSLRGTVVRD